MSNTSTMTQTSPLITIDTDNAIIRFYATRAREAGLSEAAIKGLFEDAKAIAAACGQLASVRFNAVKV